MHIIFVAVSYEISIQLLYVGTKDQDKIALYLRDYWKVWNLFLIEP